MQKKISGAVVFFVLLCIYLTALIVLSSILPIICLASFVFWMIIRQPLNYPGRMDDDIKNFSQALSKNIEKLLRILVQPLR